jgi:hypothetical protein
VKPAARDAALFVLLVTAGVASRVLFREVPNFAPIAALSLFASYFFRPSWLAPLVPLLALVIGDWFIGFYDLRLMIVVYATLTLPVALRPMVRRYLAIERHRVSATAASLLGLLTCSLSCSLLFFVTTNFACWLGSSWYTQDWQGLTSCFAGAIPFFKYTLLGDLFYSCVLFGGYALAVNLSWLPADEHATAMPVHS